MGVKGLAKLLADKAPKAMKEETVSSYVDRKIAIDASMSIYQFLIAVGRVGTRTLTNNSGEVTSHLQGMFTRTIRLLEAGINPVYVFDGQPPDLKKRELEKSYLKRENATKNLSAALVEGDDDSIEKFSKRTVKATMRHNEDCKQLLQLMGVALVEAPSEAEAQCAALCKSGEVYAVASEDMDSLTFGAPKFIRHLMDPNSKKIPIIELEVAKVLEELDISMDQFIDLCILSGCDYCDSIKGIGGQTALKLIRRHGSIENILENINRDRYHVPEYWPYEEARHIFLEPSVISGKQELKRTPPEEEGLMDFLVHRNNFSSDRVVKAIGRIKAANSKFYRRGLESFLKPVVCASEPLKEQENVCWLGVQRPAIRSRIFSMRVCICNCPASKVIGGLSSKMPVRGAGSHLHKPFLQFCLSI